MSNRCWLAVLVVMLVVTPFAGNAVGSSILTVDPHAYMKSQGFIRLWGDTHSHGYFAAFAPRGDDGSIVYQRLFEEGLEKQDFLIYTPHAEQTTAAQANQLRYEVNQRQLKGKLVGLGSEWTGSTEVGSLEHLEKYDPGNDRSQGHVIVLGSSKRIGQMSLRGGEPDLIAALYSDLLGRLVEVKEAMGILAHPSLYEPQRSFDLDGRIPGYDAPPNQEAIVPIVGCELVSHGPPATDASVVLGDGINLATSNEACYRKFLREGWRLSPYMETDNHLPKYPNGPYTCVFARERSIEGIYEAMDERLTCGTEASGYSIALLAQRCNKMGDALSAPTLMGQQILLPASEMDDTIVCVRATVRDRAGNPAPHHGLTELRFITICTVSGYDRVICADRSDPRVSEVDSGMFIWDPTWVTPDESAKGFTTAGKAVAIYATATITTTFGHKQLISAPVFIRY